MSLLSIVQTAAPRLGLPLPGAAASSSDQNIQQIVAFVNEEGQELAARHPWQAIRKEATFTTLAVEVQGTMTSIAGTDFAYILNETIWNRSQRRPVFGPKSPAEWQQLKAQLVQGPWSQYVIRGNNLLFTPAPPAGQSCYFEFVSLNWATDSTGVSGKTAMMLDSDIGVLDERLLTLGCIWRFRQAKGLEFAAAAEKYEAAVIDAMARDGGKARLNLNGNRTDYFPGVFVSAGSWGI